MSLILLPNLLDESLSHEIFLPVSIGQAVHKLQGLFAESEKSARRYLRRFLSHEEMRKISIRLLNEHTKPNEFEELFEPLLRQETWGILSDAGLPCLADPGAQLVALAHRHQIPVDALVGPSSIVLGLQLSGLASQKFFFHGYLPREIPLLQHTLKALEKQSYEQGVTQIFIEAPYRSAKLLDLILEVLKESTCLCVALNLTTSHQRVISQKIIEWKKQKEALLIEKEPAVFLFRASCKTA